MRKKCNHNAGWYTDNVLIWGDENGAYLEGRGIGGRRRQRGKVVMTCNRQGCGATRNVYFDVPIPVRLGKVQKAGVTK